jgi:hypothetical protein
VSRNLARRARPTLSDVSDWVRCGAGTLRARTEALKIALLMLVDEIASERADTGTDQRACAGLGTEGPDRGAGRQTECGACSDAGPRGVSAAGERNGSNKGQRDSDRFQVGLS